jgi:hypothetical protein
MWYPASMRKSAIKAATLPIESDERDRDQVDAFVARNREAIDASIRQSRQELAEGKVSKRTVDDIIAEGRGRHRL